MYEYKVDIYKIKYAKEAMNAYAKEGWRVIAVSPDHQSGFVDVFFERELIEEVKEDKAAAELAAAVEMIDMTPDETFGAGIEEDVPETEPETEPETAPEAVEEEIADNADHTSLEVLPYALTVCKVNHIENIDPSNDFFFIARTDSEVSLVCETDKTPFSTASREDGWKAFRIRGVLPLTATGVISKISAILADCGICIFAVSTYDTDYILVKEESLEKAKNVLTDKGYDFSK